MALQFSNRGVWSTDRSSRILPGLPHDVRRDLKRKDVAVFVHVDAPGSDRTLAPRIELDFGRQPKAVSWSLTEAAAREGVRLILPRGVRQLAIYPHTGPFRADRCTATVVRAFPRRDGMARQLFKALRGGEGGVGALSAGLLSDEAEILSSSGLALEGTGEVRTTGDGANIVFKLRRPLSPGWWRFDIDLFGRGMRPRILFPAEDGWMKGAAEMIRGRDGKYEAFAHLAAETDTLKLTLADKAGALGSLVAVTACPVRGPGLALARPSVLNACQRARAFPELWTRLFRSAGGEGPWALPVRTLSASERAFDAQLASYDLWIEAFDYRPGRDEARYRRAIRELRSKPLISILMPVYKTPLRLLDAAIESVRAQLYPHWELCIADDGSADPALTARLEQWERRDKRIKVVERPENGNISAATNSAFDLATGEFVALLDHDDVLRPHALAEVTLALAAKPEAQILYSDEDKIDAEGNRSEPFFKPDFSPYLFLGQNYFNHLTVHRASNIRAVGGWRVGYEGSQDYDLNLRVLRRIGDQGVVHIPKVLYHWRAVEGSTAASIGEKSYAFSAGLRALADHVKAQGWDAEAEQAGNLPFYRVRRHVPEPQPSVSLIIPTRDRAELVKMCVNSILNNTDYLNYEIIIVDNQSEQPETFRLFDQLSADRRVRVVKYDAPFNYSAINNYAVSTSNADIVGLVNNDIEVISPGWLTEMVSLAVQPKTGCVGAKLYYPNDTIQHGGIVLGIGGVAGHSHKYLSRDVPGYFGRMGLVHEVSAVTGACLLVRRSLYEELGGLNAENLVVAFNDVDFCLRVREAGYTNLWTPWAELYHHESVSRGQEDSPAKQVRFRAEVAYMKKKWGQRLSSDPYYSPHLSVTHEDYRLRAPD